MNDEHKIDKTSKPSEAPPSSDSAPLEMAVAPEPAADEAVKKALNVAESVGRLEAPPVENRGDDFDNVADSVSLSQIIDQAEQRSKALFEEAASEDHEPLEELDVLDIAAQFGRPSDAIGGEDETAEDVVDGYGDTKSLSPGGHRRAETEGDAALPLREDHRTDSKWNSPLEIPSPVETTAASSDVGEAPGRIGAKEEAPRRRVSVVPEPVDDVPALGENETEKPLAEEAGSDEDAARRIVSAKMSVVNEGSYFDILEVASNATDAEVRDAYRALRHEFRAERFQNAALSDMKRDAMVIRTVLNEAFEVLQRHDMRDAYRRASLNQSG